MSMLETAGRKQPGIRDGMSRDGAARWFVWSVFLVMLALLVWQVARVGSRIPLAEDWLAVAPLTGHEPDLLAWLWSQNNEHRAPLPRLLLLGVLTAAGGDFRAGQLLNVAALAATAAGLIVFARRLRGRSDPADAFFPLVLMHFGHSHLVLFAWLIVFIIPTMLTILLGCALFSQNSVSSRGPAVAAGCALLLLPLCGLNGLLFVPGLGGFLAYAGWASWSGRRGWPQRRGIGIWLLLAMLGTLILAMLYFIGYQHPWWNPPSPGFTSSFKTALKVLSYGVGPAAQFWWAPAVAAAVLFFGVSLWRAVHSLGRLSGARRDQTIGAALFLANAIGLAWIVGWARAGYVPEFGIPIRYVLPVVPAVVAGYLTWQVMAPMPAGRLVQRSLAAVMLILLPFNTTAGYRFFADWYRQGMSRLEADLSAGTPIDVLAIRYRDFLVHWWTPEELERHMRWLHEAGVRPFDRAVVKSP